MDQLFRNRHNKSLVNCIEPYTSTPVSGVKHGLDDRGETINSKELRSSAHPKALSRPRPTSANEVFLEVDGQFFNL